MIAITLAGILVPAVSVFAAETYQILKSDMTTKRYICYEGMIPCGKNMMCSQNDNPITDGKCDPSKGTGATGTIIGCNPRPVNLVTIDCQLCHFFILGKGVLAFVFKIVMAVSALLIVVGGFMYLVCSGNPGCISRANSIFKSVAIGVAIIFAAWIVVGTVFVQLGVQPWTGLISWHRITCPIVSDCCQ